MGFDASRATVTLLTRGQFREAVFARDRHACVVCLDPAVDAHHILERKLWPDGGYYLDNGAALCARHHLEAEATTLSCDDIRRCAGVTVVMLPPQLYDDCRYDKWGNEVLPGDARVPGELFHDPSVQKALAPVLYLFGLRIKHPRTYHLPWSRGVTRDDRVMESLEGLRGEALVVTEKMDGENTTLYRHGFHARSVQSGSHPSRNWLWPIVQRIQNDLPRGWRVCGENLWAKHSILYRSLKSYFMVHSIWDEANVCLSWQDTKEWTALLDLTTVPLVGFIAPTDRFAEAQLDPLCYGYGDYREGYVARVARSFPYREYRRVVGKFVRAGHVQTHGHWMRELIVKNELETQ